VPDLSPNNVRELIELRVDQFPDKPFVYSESDGRVFSYRDFDRLVNRTANLLLSKGVSKGDRVSLFLSNRLEYFVFYMACFKIGAWAGPVNALLKPSEVAYVVDHSQATLAVTEPSLHPTLLEASPAAKSLRQIILVNSDSLNTADRGYYPACRRQLQTSSYEVEVKEQSDGLVVSSIDPADEAMIIYTSGTTGKPKGVLLTHRNLITNAREIASWLKLTDKDRAMMIMPLFHVNALMTTGLASLWAGGSVVIASKFSASRHWDMISRHRVTYFGSVATMLSLLNHTCPRGLPEGCDTTSLRFALCGSAPVPAEVMKEFESLFNCPVVEGYGLSESTCRATFNPIEHRRPGSIGLPIGNEVDIFDEDDHPVGPAAIGEIVLRGANIMKGYYRNEAATAEALRSGWLHTGDLGYRDAGGFFYIVDRKGDMIIRGGENIYPREIDEVLYEHPKVKEAATIGVPDELFGEEVKAFVVLRDGHDSTAEELLLYCRSKLADFKCPKSIEFLDEIPKGPTGKLLKRELQDSSK
jgi:long-chain acyl-CoA synthetase